LKCQCKAIDVSRRAVDIEPVLRFCSSATGTIECHFLFSWLKTITPVR